MGRHPIDECQSPKRSNSNCGSDIIACGRDGRHATTFQNPALIGILASWGIQGGLDPERTEPRKEMRVIRLYPLPTSVPTIRCFRVQWGLPMVAIALLLSTGCSSDDDGPTNTPAALAIDLTSPANGAQISGEVLLLATAPEAEAVAFLVDGTEVGTDSSSPFAFSWNSETVSNGGHRITARASRAAASPCRT